MATVGRTEVIQQHEKNALFSALEAMANMPNMDLKTRRLFNQQHPWFLSAFGSNLAENAEFIWHQKQLQNVWSGRDPAGVRALILLGIEKPYYLPYTESAIPDQIKRDPTMAVDLAALVAVLSEVERKDLNRFAFGHIGLPAAQFSCDWQHGEITYQFETQFQEALYLLMRESWRAKVCPSCGKYFIADKPAQRHCSSACYGDMKRKRAMEWQRNARREAKRKRKR